MTTTYVPCSVHGRHRADSAAASGYCRAMLEADDAPTREPIRVPDDASATRFAVNRNWNRRGPHAPRRTR